ncbi:EamA family transporter [Ancylobacter sp. 6x-1]|uniref:EamA family transporter n=1 Tax=Ancylobacter crimeensis TaxID=2579147 RepID=A0ABT0D6H1_9HYPH|nr:EamA family transporter [Ancylobacter crimeensis]MCK0195513.1 EamA family transporter [Ancylobacter crimeensis]
MPFRDKLLAIAVVCAWALNIIIVKLGTAEIPPIFISALRFMLVAALVAPFTRLTRQQLPWVLVVSVTFGIMHFGLLFIALSMAEAGTSSILVQLGAPIATVLACIVFKERFGPLRMIGLALSVVGIVVLAAGPTLPAPLPLALLLLSATGWAVTNLIIKSMPKIQPLTMMGWSSLFAAPQLMLASFFLEHDQLASLHTASWHGWLCIVYSAIMSSIIAYGIWYWLLQRHPINTVVPYSMLNPLLSVLFGILMLGELPAPVKLVGSVVMMAGVALILRPERAAAVPERA